jgi:hypothetical protein
MSLQEQISNEYSSIVQTKFWSLFMNEITERRKLAQRDCETREDVRKAQGEIIAYDWILGRKEQPALSERLILKLRGQSITEEAKT